MALHHAGVENDKFENVFGIESGGGQAPAGSKSKSAAGPREKTCREAWGKRKRVPGKKLASEQIMVSRLYVFVFLKFFEARKQLDRNRTAD